MTDDEKWAAIHEMAKVLKAENPAPAAAFNIQGRFITVLVDALAKFWKAHRDTLIPVLSQLAIAALEAIAAQAASIRNINQRGPT